MPIREKLNCEVVGKDKWLSNLNIAHKLFSIECPKVSMQFGCDISCERSEENSQYIVYFSESLIKKRRPKKMRKQPSRLAYGKAIFMSFITVIQNKRHNIWGCINDQINVIYKLQMLFKITYKTTILMTLLTTHSNVFPFQKQRLFNNSFAKRRFSNTQPPIQVYQ